MEHLHLASVLILLILGFFAAFIDSTVGGGGLISLPTLLFVGLPPALALGTNKLAGTMSAVASTASYFKSGKIDGKLIKCLVPLSFIGSACGAYLIHFLPTSFLKPIVLILLVAVTVYTIFKKDIGKHMTYTGITKRLLFMGMAVAFIIGFYDGFFGPGTGSFLIIAFIFMGFDFVQASGNAKALNLASNISALATFAWLKSIDYEYGLIIGIAMVIGATVGSQVAIRKGATYIRPLFICVTLIMIGQQVWTDLKL